MEADSLPTNERRRTKRQQEVIDYLREHGETEQQALANALGSTLRGIGVVLSKLLWEDEPVVTVRMGHAWGSYWRLRCG